MRIEYLFSRMQQQGEPGPEARGKESEIRNKSELPKYECSKQFSKSLSVQ
jgi:hypothetical protein